MTCFFFNLPFVIMIIIVITIIPYHIMSIEYTASESIIFNPCSRLNSHVDSNWLASGWTIQNVWGWVHWHRRPTTMDFDDETDDFIILMESSSTFNMKFSRLIRHTSVLIQRGTSSTSLILGNWFLKWPFTFDWIFNKFLNSLLLEIPWIHYRTDSIVTQLSPILAKEK